MKQKKRKIYIGISGWVYSHWERKFYPENLSSKDKFKYFSQQFKTAEVNYSFYRLPKVSTYQKWYSQTPDDFLFGVKESRYITHVKRLKGVKRPWETFVKNALNLKEKLGPILFQFPPSFRATEENVKRLEEFLKFIRLNPRRYPLLKYAFEFRHKSFCDKKIYGLLKKFNTAWVIADSPKYPRVDKFTADFSYVRMHGSDIMFSSKYTEKELGELADKIRNWQRETKEIFIYFNNDTEGFAIDNAKTLGKLLAL